MKNININLGQVYVQCAFKPTTTLFIEGKKRVVPLFARTEEYINNIQQDDSDRSIITNPEFISKSNKTVNSPTNIRSLVITHRGVLSNYWFSYTYHSVKGDRPVNPNCSFSATAKAIKDNYKDKPDVAQLTVPEYANGILNGLMHPGQVEVMYNTDTRNNTALSRVLKRYALSNIEEIYFDYSMLLDCPKNFGVDKASRALFEMTFNSQQVNFSGLNNTFGKPSEPNGLPMQSLLFQLYKESSPITLKQLRKDFPKLKYVGYISRCGDLFDAVSKKSPINNAFIPNTIDRRKLTTVDSLELSETWYSKNLSRLDMGLKQLAQRMTSRINSLVLISRLDNLAELPLAPVNEWTSRSGVYKYDRDTLEPSFNTLKKTLTSSVAYNKPETGVTGASGTGATNGDGGNVEEVKPEPITNKTEQWLIQMCSTNGSLDRAKVLAILTPVINTSPVSEIRDEFSQFTAHTRGQLKEKVPELKRFLE